MISDTSDPYVVSEAAVIAALAVEEVLPAVEDALIDPPDSSPGCVCPQRFPELWPPRFQHRWPLKWGPMALLFFVALWLVFLSGKGEGVPRPVSLFLGFLGLAAGLGGVAATLQTSVTVQYYGDLMIRRSILDLAVFRKRLSGTRITQLELHTLPVRVLPGRHPRDYYTLQLRHRDGVLPIHQEDRRASLEIPGQAMAAALGVPLRYSSECTVLPPNRS